MVWETQNEIDLRASKAWYSITHTSILAPTLDKLNKVAVILSYSMLLIVLLCSHSYFSDQNKKMVHNFAAHFGIHMDEM